MEPRAEVKNAADPQQVQRAKRKAQRADERRLDAFRAVMATPAGRMVMWDLIGSAGVCRSVFNSHEGRQNYNIGRQDFGHELVATLLEADETLYLLMEKEARALVKRDAVETDAGHTAPASEGA